MKAIITGGAGFIGSTIAQILNEKGYQIIVYDNLSSGSENNIEGLKNVKFIKEDILNYNALEKAMNGCELVFHLAASIGNLKSIQDPVLDSTLNVIGTINVINAARANQIKKIVYSSSAAIFGEPKYQPIDENHPFAPDSPYGVSKLSGELQCLCHNHIYDMKITCLRYFNVYGIKQKYDLYGNVIPIFASKLIQNSPLTIYGNGEQTRDFVNVRDVAMANVLAGENKNISGVFNIGSGQAITINFLAESMLKINGVKSKIEYLPERKGEVLHSLADITKAKKAFGFSPSLDIHNELTEYLRWFKKTVAENY